MAVDELRSLFVFEGLSDEQLQQLDTAATVVPFHEGDVLFREGDPADFWWVLLEGRVELLRQSGHEQSVIAVMERPGVWAGGFRAWTDSVGYLATARPASSGRMLQVPAAALGDFVRTWFPFSIHIIEGFFQTVRMMDALSRRARSARRARNARGRPRARAQQSCVGGDARRRRAAGDDRHASSSPSCSSPRDPCRRSSS